MEAQIILSITNAKEAFLILGALVGLLGGLAGFLISLKLYLQYAPIVIFRITPLWTTSVSDAVILRIEIENKSKVKLTKDQILFKIIRHKKSTLTELKEWVTPEDSEFICESTKILYPGDVIKIDRLYKCAEDEIIQGLIQFRAKFSKFEKILADVKDENESWTNTFIIAK